MGEPQAQLGGTTATLSYDKDGWLVVDVRVDKDLLGPEATPVTGVLGLPLVHVRLDGKELWTPEMARDIDPPHHVTLTGLWANGGKDYAVRSDSLWPEKLESLWESFTARRVSPRAKDGEELLDQWGGHILVPHVAYAGDEIHVEIQTHATARKKKAVWRVVKGWPGGKKVERAWLDESARSIGREASITLGLLVPPEDA